MFTGVNKVTTVLLLIQKCHVISEGELAFSFSTSAAFVAVSVVNFNGLLENKIKKVSGII